MERGAKISWVSNPKREYKIYPYQNSLNSTIVSNPKREYKIPNLHQFSHLHEIVSNPKREYKMLEEFNVDFDFDLFQTLKGNIK